MMTKKTFIELANMVKQLQAEIQPLVTPENMVDRLFNQHLKGCIAQLDLTRDALADFCQAQNPCFDRVR